MWVSVCVALISFFLGVGLALFCVGRHYALRKTHTWEKRIPRDHYYEGTQIRLSAGETRYRIFGEGMENPKGLIVCVHGLSMPAQLMWSDFGRHAESQQYLTLTYDLYGRGGSEAPYLPQTPSLFTSQLAELLWALENEGKIPLLKNFILIGLSLGGAISAHFAQTYPSRIQRLILLAPAGLGAPVPAISFLLDIPFLGEILVEKLGHLFYIGAVKKDFKGRTQTEWKGDGTMEEFLQKLTNILHFQFHKRKGFAASLLSISRNFPANNMECVYSEISEMIPVHFLWGDNDNICPIPSSDKLAALVPSSYFHVIKGGSHDFLISRAQEVRDCIFAQILHGDSPH